MLVHYSNPEVDQWMMKNTPNFSPAEIACRCCGRISWHSESRDALLKLQKMRELLGGPILISSGTRCPDHNSRVSGAKNSYHLAGRAFDVRTPDGTGFGKLIAAAYGAGFTGYGIYDTFTHLDTGPDRIWNG